MRHLKITTLPTAKTWLDKDMIMLHACFQLLTDFIEQEKGDEHVCPKVHKDFVDEVRFLYKWWKKRLLDESVDSDKDDDKMLIRLMKIRTALWT